MAGDLAEIEIEHVMNTSYVQFWMKFMYIV
jgi:hypothetical protein